MPTHTAIREASQSTINLSDQYPGLRLQEIRTIKSDYWVGRLAVWPAAIAPGVHERALAIMGNDRTAAALELGQDTYSLLDVFDETPDEWAAPFTGNHLHLKASEVFTPELGDFAVVLQHRSGEEARLHIGANDVDEDGNQVITEVFAPVRIAHVALPLGFTRSVLRLTTDYRNIAGDEVLHGGMFLDPGAPPTHDQSGAIGLEIYS